MNYDPERQQGVMKKVTIAAAIATAIGVGTLALLVYSLFTSCASPINEKALMEADLRDYHVYANNSLDSLALTRNRRIKAYYNEIDSLMTGHGDYPCPVTCPTGAIGDTIGLPHTNGVINKWGRQRIATLRYEIGRQTKIYEEWRIIFQEEITKKKEDIYVAQ